MQARLARRLAAMHAPKWRARYGNEFEALLIDLPASPANLADVARSILASRRGSLVAALALATAVLMTLLGFARPGAPAHFALWKHMGRSVACVHGGHVHRAKHHSVG